MQGQLFLLQQAVYNGPDLQKIVVTRSLLKIGVRSQAFGFILVGLGCGRGHDDDGNVRAFLALPETFQHFEPVGPGKIDVEQNQIRTRRRFVRFGARNQADGRLAIVQELQIRIQVVAAIACFTRKTSIGLSSITTSDARRPLPSARDPKEEPSSASRF